MSIADEIKQLQKEGRTEQEIMQALQSKGYTMAQISDALSQTKIKQAVSEQSPQTQTIQQAQEQQQEQPPERPIHPALPPPTPSSGSEEEKITSSQQKPMTKEMEGMGPSLLSSERKSKQEPEAPKPIQAQNPQEQETQYQDDYQYPQEQYQYPQEQSQQYQDYYQYPQGQAQQYQDYYQYPQYSGSLSSDTISEISEQVVSEKLSMIRDRLEKIIDMKNTFETKTSMLDKRLKRIEEIIDKLQLSILQKIGEYASNIDDIKQELIETQKTFKTLAPVSKRRRSRKHP